MRRTGERDNTPSVLHFLQLRCLNPADRLLTLPFHPLREGVIVYVRPGVTELLLIPVLIEMAGYSICEHYRG